MKEKLSLKDTLSLVYFIVALYVGVYYTMKWFMMGTVYMISWICDKFDSRKNLEEDKEE